MRLLFHKGDNILGHQFFLGIAVVRKDPAVAILPEGATSLHVNATEQFRHGSWLATFLD